MEILSNNYWLNVLGWLASICAVSYFIRRVTKDFDEDLAPEFRLKITRQLKRVKVGDADWLFSFDSIFTEIFGTKHLSWRCFSRSMAVSGLLFAFLIVATGALAVDVTQIGDLVGQGPFLGALLWILLLVAVGMTFNGILDYLSLWGTRLVIRLPLPPLVKVAVNVTFTTIVVRVIFAFFLGLIVYSGLSYAFQYGADEPNGAILQVFLLYGLQFMEFPPQFGSLAFVIFATSFSTSIWLALHLMSGVLIRWLPGAVSMLNADQAPVRAIGIVSIGVIWLLGILFGFIVLLYYWASAG
ncbi:hypothetical protein MA04_00687 [Alcanivorax balearicus MACL04]|uniref:Yip1 domain-containing protein n=1 Tax=Alloalcanivorax balearicus MACL04 TaxID=1177182 RepID=A0ABT2QV61_9GAMM|nr:hypothetical protein [Alloalcanivorax balearicus]MCU5781387.1 hypothetical protein [Alloalcanivorax balearicus MACL04]